MPHERWRRQLAAAVAVVCVTYPRAHACKSAAYIPLRAPNGRWLVEQWRVMRDDGGQHETWELDGALSTQEAMKVVRERVTLLAQRTGATVREFAMNPERNVDRFVTEVRGAAHPDRAQPELALAL